MHALPPLFRNTPTHAQTVRGTPGSRFAPTCRRGMPSSKARTCPSSRAESPVTSAARVWLPSLPERSSAITPDPCTPRQPESDSFLSRCFDCCGRLCGVACGVACCGGGGDSEGGKGARWHLAAAFKLPAADCTRCFRGCGVLPLKPPPAGGCVSFFRALVPPPSSGSSSSCRCCWCCWYCWF